MNTPLYINNMYCLSIVDLKSTLSLAVNEKELLYEDLLIVIHDGILEQWLKEGTEEECLLAETLQEFKDPRHALNKLCIELDLPTIL